MTRNERFQVGRPRGSAGTYFAQHCGCVEYTSTLGTMYLTPGCWSGLWTALRHERRATLRWLAHRIGHLL